MRQQGDDFLFLSRGQQARTQTEQEQLQQQQQSQLTNANGPNSKYYLNFLCVQQNSLKYKKKATALFCQHLLLRCEFLPKGLLVVVGVIILLHCREHQTDTRVTLGELFHKLFHFLVIMSTNNKMKKKINLQTSDPITAAQYSFVAF